MTMCNFSPVLAQDWWKDSWPTGSMRVKQHEHSLTHIHCDLPVIVLLTSAKGLSILAQDLWDLYSMNVLLLVLEHVMGWVNARARANSSPPIRKRACVWAMLWDLLHYLKLWVLLYYLSSCYLLWALLYYLIITSTFLLHLSSSPGLIAREKMKWSAGL